MIAGIITLPTRVDYAEQVKEAFEGLGIYTKIFVSDADWPIGPYGNAANALQVLRWADDNDEDLLFLEDDIFFKKDRLLRFLEQLGEHVVYLYSHEDYALQRIPREEKKLLMQTRRSYNFWKRDWQMRNREIVIPEGIRELGDVYLWGTQCVYIPSWAVKELANYVTVGAVRDEANNVTIKSELPFDRQLINWHRENKVSTRVAFPSPVQHKQVRVSRVGSVVGRLSKSFHSVSDKEVQDG